MFFKEQSLFFMHLIKLSVFRKHTLYISLENSQKHCAECYTLSSHYDWSAPDPCWLWVSVCVCCGQGPYYTGHLTAALLPSSLQDWKSFLFQLHPQHCEMKCHPVWYWAFWKLSCCSWSQSNIWQDTRGFNANLPLKCIFILAFERDHLTITFAVQ